MIIYLLLKKYISKENSAKVNLQKILLALYFDILIVMCIALILSIIVAPEVFFPYHIHPRGWVIIGIIILYIIIRCGAIV